MSAPTLIVRYTTDDASDTTPSWTTVTNANVRAFSSSRGRDSELGQVDAGTAQLILNNRTRLFDPAVVTGLRPMNRWWIQASFNAVTYDIFFGFAEAYEQQWPAEGKDAITVVQLVDLFKVLALNRLPVMNPPRDSYQDLVMFDDPQGYWRFQETSVTNGFQPTAGSVRMGWSSLGLTTSPIVGDWDAGTAAGRGAVSTTTRLHTIDSDNLPGLEVNGPGDADGLTTFSWETWFKTTEAAPGGGGRFLMTGPLSGAVSTWGLYQNADGRLTAYVRPSGGVQANATEASATIAANTWYHLMGTYDNSFVRLLLNGVQVGSTAATGAVGAMDAGGFMVLGETPAPGGTRTYDEVAFYRTALSGARALAHYTAGVNRGFVTQDPGARISAVLTAAGNTAATSIRAGSREMTPTFMTGQPPLDELRRAENADSVDAVLFISKNGTITFLDDGHRSVSPWNTVQSTFDDDGTDLSYKEATVDYSDNFIFNDIQVTTTVGTTNTATDSTSVSRYLTRPLQHPDLPLTTEADAASITTALLAKYKDPFQRVTSLTVELHQSAVITAALNREIGDRVRIFRTQPGGGARLDQTSFIQRIQVTYTPQRPMMIRFGVSPL